MEDFKMLHIRPVKGPGQKQGQREFGEDGMVKTRHNSCQLKHNGQEMNMEGNQ